MNIFINEETYANVSVATVDRINGKIIIKLNLKDESDIKVTLNKTDVVIMSFSDS